MAKRTKFFESLPPRLKVFAHALELAIPAGYVAVTTIKHDWGYDVLHERPELAYWYIGAVAVARLLVELFIGDGANTNHGNQ